MYACLRRSGVNKFYAVKLLLDGVEVGYLGFDGEYAPILVDLEYAAFYVVKDDAAKCVTELVKYTSKVVMVSMIVDE